MKTKVTNNCQLEIDRLRGVIYVHSPEGETLLRVCGVPIAVIDRGFIDIVYDRELAKEYPSVEDLERR